jgi:hypothetical protein
VHAEHGQPGEVDRPPGGPRVISTEDPEARHGRKTRARRFDGYKGCVAVDPDSEIITDTGVTPANAGDADATDELLAEFVADPGDDAATDEGAAASDRAPRGPRRGGHP